MSYLTTISEIVILIWLFLLAVSLLIKNVLGLKQSFSSSFDITLFICTCCFGVQIAIEYYLTGLFEADYVVNNEYYLNMLRASWYFSYALADFIGAAVVVYTIRRLNLTIDFYSILFLASFYILGFAQLFRYADRFILETDVFTLYKDFIPAINSTLGLVSVVYIVNLLVKTTIIIKARL